jgi:hypothetical protein
MKEKRDRVKHISDAGLCELNQRPALVLSIGARGVGRRSRSMVRRCEVQARGNPEIRRGHVYKKFGANQAAKTPADRLEDWLCAWLHSKVHAKG